MSPVHCSEAKCWTFIHPATPPPPPPSPSHVSAPLPRRNKRPGHQLLAVICMAGQCLLDCQYNLECLRLLHTSWPGGLRLSKASGKMRTNAMQRRHCMQPDGSKAIWQGPCVPSMSLASYITSSDLPSMTSVKKRAIHAGLARTIQFYRLRVQTSCLMLNYPQSKPFVSIRLDIAGKGVCPSVPANVQMHLVDQIDCIPIPRPNLLGPSVI